MIERTLLLALLLTVIPQGEVDGGFPLSPAPSLLSSPAPREGAFLQVKGAFHVHTTFSTGALSLEEVIEEARREGIGIVILTDNLLLRFEYGLFPLRGLVKKVVEKPSILQMGVERYLQAIAAAQARFPDVILIPGVEVVPYYYWTGSLFKGDLTQWDAQKNLLVVGLSQPEDYKQIPAIGNGCWILDVRCWRLGNPNIQHLTLNTLLKLVLAMVAMGGGILLLRMRRAQAIRLKHFTLKVQKRYRLPGWIALGIGAILLLEASTSSGLNPYQGSLGIGPYQRIIEFVEAKRGMVFWSFPQARDFNWIELGPLGNVVVRTEPYPEALLQSQGYTGFGALYPDIATFTEPGRQWDQLLLEHTEGRRERPAWGIGELGYHGPPKRFSEALTVFLVPERSGTAILQALKEGRFYSIRPLPDYSLVLENFSIRQEGRKSEVPMGGKLEAEGEGSLLIRLRISASDGREVPFTLRLIRSGNVLSTLQAKTPFEEILKVKPPEGGKQEFFRIEITKPHRLLSNPIFVRRRGAALSGAKG